MVQNKAVFDFVNRVVVVLSPGLMDPLAAVALHVVAVETHVHMVRLNPFPDIQLGETMNAFLGQLQKDPLELNIDHVQILK